MNIPEIMERREVEVLRQCLRRTGHLARLTAQVADSPDDDSGQRASSGVLPQPSREEEQVAVEALRLSTLWSAFAHPVPHDPIRGWHIPTAHGTVSAYALAEVLDEGESAARRMCVGSSSSSTDDFSQGRAVEGTLCVGNDWKELVAGHTGILHTPGADADHDSRPEHVQWVRDFAGGLVPFQPQWMRPNSALAR